MKILNVLFGTLYKNSIKYDRLKRDEEKRMNSNRLGVYSLISTVCGVIFSVLMIWAISMLLDKTGSMKDGGTLETLLIIIGVALLIIVLIELIFQLVINGLFCAVLQLRLNKKPIGFVALFLWLALCLASAKAQSHSRC